MILQRTDHLEADGLPPIPSIQLSADEERRIIVTYKGETFGDALARWRQAGMDQYARVSVFRSLVVRKFLDAKKFSHNAIKQLAWIEAMRAFPAVVPEPVEGEQPEALEVELSDFVVEDTSKKKEKGSGKEKPAIGSRVQQEELDEEAYESSEHTPYGLPEGDGNPDMVADILWAYENLDRRRTKARHAPSPGAWSLLNWGREYRNHFFQTLVPKALAARDREAKAAGLSGANADGDPDLDATSDFLRKLASRGGKPPE